jgi:uncharacterized protein (TIGR03437 family)
LGYNAVAVIRSWLTLAALVTGAAWGGAPSYSASSIVNSPNSAPGPFAPNSVLTIYGTDLGRAEHFLTVSDIRSGYLPTEMEYTRVFVDNLAAPLLYVSETQINFMIPADEIPGDAKVRVVRESLRGPEITIKLVNSAPALFVLPGDLAIATHADGSLITADAPARPLETIVIYLTGLGRTSPIVESGEIPRNAAQSVWRKDLKVWLADAAVDPIMVKYAGITPGSAGLYQINLLLPSDVAEDPEIRVSVGDQSSPPGLKIPLKRTSPQLNSESAR